MNRIQVVLLLFLPLCTVGCTDQGLTVSWEPVGAGLPSSLRGLAVVDENTVWISGTEGGYAFTRDGGETWTVGTVPGADSLDFRDVEAFTDGTAYLMAAGIGEASRIYRSPDWGENWTLQHMNLIPGGFFNGMAFWDETSGMVVGDPVAGVLFLLHTSDGGENWTRLSGDHSPEVMDEEYGFAASGTNIVTFGQNGVAVASGGPVARVFRSEDRGASWLAVRTPMAAGTPSSGIFSIAFRDEASASIVGGNYQETGLQAGTIATSSDGGKSWARALEPHGVGFRSGVGWRQDPTHSMWVSVGTPGSSYSLDGGFSWVTFDVEPFNAVAFSGPVGWAAGPAGSVARLLVK